MEKVILISLGEEKLGGSCNMRNAHRLVNVTHRQHPKTIADRGKLRGHVVGTANQGNVDPKGKSGLPLDILFSVSIISGIHAWHARDSRHAEYSESFERSVQKVIKE